ncbi:MAG: molybdopterin-dependent oxidoreductase [Chloroflexi bacterium]|nr:molybdopterin-dependent oxidoreductase [Chloroflexota bacterium]
MLYSRRDFLKLATTSTAGIALFTGCQTYLRPIPRAEFLLQSPARIPEDLVTGVDNHYATVCRHCPAGCGILARVMEGRAKKIEGNPDYPVNAGKHCARGEASLQALYHPDRLTGPVRRAGDRGQMRFQPISWDEALDELVNRLRQLHAAGQANALLAITEPLRGHRALIVDRFVKALGAQHLAFEPLEEGTLRVAIQRVFGQAQLPEFEIQDTQYLLSFGADFVGTWLSPVRYGRKFGEFRQGHPDRGLFVQVEPRFSTTAASADVWIPIQPGTEGVLALSIAQVMIADGVADASTARALSGPPGTEALAAFQPARAAEITGVPVERIRELARELATRRPSLVIGGGPAAAQTNGFFNLQAIYALNFLIGSVGSRGGIRFNPQAVLQDIPIVNGAPFSAWQNLAARLLDPGVEPPSLVLIHNADPVYGLPATLRFGEAMARAPFIVSFSSFIDDTTALADLILPDHIFLEDWGDDIPEPGPGFEVVGFQQPVVKPTGDTRGFADVLLTVAEELGGDVHRALPWNTFRDALRDGAKQLQALRRGSVQSTDPEEFWLTLLQHGGWWDEQATSRVAPPAPTALPRESQLPTFAGSQEEFPFHLIVFPSNSLLSGQVAHLPWLQGLPDPTSTVVWQSWIEINPSTAERLNIRTGDLLVVESPSGALEVPAYLHPATAPNVVAMPGGQGHTRFPRYAGGRGSNPQDIVAPLMDTETGALAWAATRVKIRKTGKSIELPRFEGVVPVLQLPDAELVPIVTT